MGHIAQKAVLLIVANQLAEAFFGFRLLPQDFFDSLSGHVSSAVVLALFAVLVARMYFFNSIDCVVPAEWPDPWEQAAEAYCYMEGAYAVPGANINKTGPAAWEVKVPQTYYYWLPMILMVLAFLLKLPDLLWSFICEQVATQPHQTLQAAAALAEPAANAGEHGDASESESDESSSEDENEHQDEAGRLKRHLGAHLMSKGKSSAVQPVSLSGSRLFLTYLMIKGLRLLAILGCLFYLQYSFELSNPMFGIAGLTRQSKQADGVVETPAFPTLTFCDVPLRQLGGWNKRTLQCILPINLLVNKTALFLWFWLVACGLLLVCSTLLWLVRVALRSRRRSYVKTFARVMLDHLEKRQRRRRRWWKTLGRWAQPSGTSGGTGAAEDQWHRRQKEAQLVRTLADTDRVFLLRLIQDRLGMAAAYIALEAMANHFERVEQLGGAGGRRPRQFFDPERV
ncbi:hypothetical protein BOX15_Mlig016285g1 [Macrostomum lignano]|uniref:Uncharacterized protein n=2 Tax=Macrostomum lignano TaxID=282301 RepID=A0A267GIM3_9PLAT|nr:hypothetical protein BOX15_Mlig016285g2 [Macrostomum lignano]PAA85901.1 hypothetical protein BOX15_Mlig016285g1 [Macrostomum lignano]